MYTPFGEVVIEQYLYFATDNCIVCHMHDCLLTTLPPEMLGITVNKTQVKIISAKGKPVKVTAIHESYTLSKYCTVSLS